MPLPFSKHDGRRQYQCFVCGVLTGSDFNAFKEHIKSNHEENREYIICPLAHCGAPVRDMRTHFKVKHKGTKLPSNCPLRCVCWKDPRDPKRRKRKVTFAEGNFYSAKNRKKMHYRSSWEQEVYQLLEESDDVKGYEVEPLEIPYFHNGEHKNYLPDLRVHFWDSRIEVWEIKPVNQTLLSINEAKWAACGAHCKIRGWNFRIITEVGIAKLKQGIWN
jgi:hypothetical protein